MDVDKIKQKSESRVLSDLKNNTISSTMSINKVKMQTNVCVVKVNTKISGEHQRRNSSDIDKNLLEKNSIKKPGYSLSSSNTNTASSNLSTEGVGFQRKGM